MKDKTKKIISFLTSFMVCTSICSINIFTASAEEIESESTISDSVTEEDSTTESNSYENFFGYELPENYAERHIEDLKYRMSFFDTFIFDNGYTLDDILNGYCFI